MNCYFCPFVQYTLTSHSLFLLRTYSKNQTRTITTKRHECHKTVLYFVGEGDWYENLRTFGMTNRFDFSPKTHAAVQKAEARKNVAVRNMCLTCSKRVLCFKLFSIGRKYRQEHPLSVVESVEIALYMSVFVCSARDFSFDAR